MRIEVIAQYMGIVTMHCEVRTLRSIMPAGCSVGLFIHIAKK